MATPEVGEATSIWVQIGGGVVGVLTIIGMAWNSIKGQKAVEKPEGATHMVMESASLADTRPFRDLLNTLVAATDRNVATNEAIRTLTERGVEASEAILEAMHEWVKEERDRRRDEERDELNEARFRAAVDKALKDIDQTRRHKPD